MFSLFKKVINTIKTANIDNNIDHGHVEEIKTIEHPEHKFNKLNLDRTPDPEVINKVENGDICLLIDKTENKHWLATKEETGFFTFDCEYLDRGETLLLLGKLVNIETK